MNGEKPMPVNSDDVHLLGSHLDPSFGAAPVIPAAKMPTVLAAAYELFANENSGKAPSTDAEALLKKSHEE